MIWRDTNLPALNRNIQRDATRDNNELAGLSRKPESHLFYGPYAGWKSGWQSCSQVSACRVGHSESENTWAWLQSFVMVKLHFFLVIEFSTERGPCRKFLFDMCHSNSRFPEKWKIPTFSWRRSRCNKSRAFVCPLTVTVRPMTDECVRSIPLDFYHCLMDLEILRWVRSRSNIAFYCAT